MNIKTLNVFYGGDFLPYKDKERQVHYPNVGSDFQGAENITDIRFYIDNIASNNTTFAVAIELPNGKIGSKVLEPAQYDSELDEYYVTLSIDKFVTQKAGNVSISLRGYQGDVELEYDDESQLYVLVSGTPITAVTGSIKLRVNQEPQGLQGEIDEEVTLQELLGLVATKLDINKGIVILGDISTANLSGYDEGQLFYDNDTHTYYQKTDTSPYYTKALSGMGVLGAPNILCRSDDSTRTIAQLHTIYGDSAYLVLRYLGKDYLYFSKKTSSTYTCVAFDIEEQRFYKASGLSGSALPSTILIPANKIEIASKAFLVSNYVPYNGANADVDLGEQKISAKQLNLPRGKVRNDSVDDNATLLDGKFLYDNEHTDQKEDERAISSVKFVLDNALNLDEVSEIGEGEYAYLLKTNSTILLSGYIYKHITDTQTDLVYAFFNGSVTTQTDGTSLYLGAIIKISKTEVGGVHQYNRESVDIDLYSKSQAKDKFATNFTASLDNSTYVLTFTLKNANGSTLATQTIDLPLESIVTSMTYYDEYTYGGTTYHNVLVIVLATTSVPTIVPVGSLISGLEHEALVEVSDISTPLTASQLALMEYPNAMIKYGYNVYLKAEDNGTYITLSVPYISLATNSGHEEATRKFIVVTKSSGAMALTSDTTSFYNKSQADSLLGEKADAISVVTDSDIETLGGAVTRIRKGNTWNVVAQQVNMSTTPKVVQSVADLPADNDGYLYVVLDNGYLYSWDEENQEWAQQYQYTSDLLTITEVDIDED
jgi:hypothetical protein